MSRAYNGGSKTYRSKAEPATDAEVVSLVEQFIRDEFKSGDEVADEVSGNEDKQLIFFADDDEQESPATFKQEGDLIAYGSFTYRARDHSVQTIWENQFEVRSVSSGILVRVSDWYGTTVTSWDKKRTRKTMYLP